MESGTSRGAIRGTTSKANTHLLCKSKQTQQSAELRVRKDLMSNIIFLLSSIRRKMNVNEMENGEERKGR